MNRGRLRHLASVAGIQTGFTTAAGHRAVASDDVVIAVLGALGIDATTSSAIDAAAERIAEERRDRVVEPVIVAWEGRLDDVSAHVSTREPVRVTIRADDGGTEDLTRSVVPVPVDAGDGAATLPLGIRLPLGYHRLSAEQGRRRGEALVVAAPRRAPAPAEPLCGIFVPLLGLRGGSASGTGSFPDLARLRGWLEELGGQVVATLPVLAAFLDEPFDPSPYSPASRLFWNELFVDPDLPPIGGGSSGRRSRSTRRAVDVRAAIATLRGRLEPVAETTFAGELPHALRRFLRERPAVRDYARFRVELERRGTGWTSWPPAAREGGLRGDALADPVGRYHVLAQWAAHEQMAAAAVRSDAEPRGLCLDLPLGVHPEGYDVWRHRAAFASGASAGAPPDAFFTAGQSWGFPPPHPQGVRESGYAYPIACLRHLLGSAAFLRIDHVMGLHRLWWVPDGMEPSQGVYVRYRPEEWHAIVALEASRAGSVVVGEDLGTVPTAVRRSMRAHGLLSSYVVQFEARPRGDDVLPDPPPTSQASVNTHDMPTWAAFWSGDDLRSAEEHGWLTGETLTRAREDRERVRRRLRTMFLVPEGDDEARQVLVSLLRTLAIGPAAITIASLEDLWEERRPVNVPGTSSPENWTRRVAWSLDRIVADDALSSTLGDLVALRRSSGEAA